MTNIYEIRVTYYTRLKPVKEQVSEEDLGARVSKLMADKTIQFVEVWRVHET